MSKKSAEHSLSVPKNIVVLKLKIMHLNNNIFSSSIPVVVGEMHVLQELFLFNNKLIGN